MTGWLQQDYDEHDAREAQLRPVDNNGHVPVDPAPAKLPPDEYTRGWNAGYNQALVDFLVKLGPRVEACADMLDQLDQLEGMRKA